MQLFLCKYQRARFDRLQHFQENVGWFSMISDHCSGETVWLTGPKLENIIESKNSLEANSSPIKGPLKQHRLE